MKKHASHIAILIGLLCIGNLQVQAQNDKKDTTIVFSKVESAAAFPGGVDGWRRYLESNLQYPSKAVRKNIQGVVRVQMMVDATGKVKEANALNDPGGGLAAEAVRVIKQGPAWVPAEQNGKRVNFRFIQTITFQLQ